MSGFRNAGRLTGKAKSTAQHSRGNPIMKPSSATKTASPSPRPRCTTDTPLAGSTSGVASTKADLLTEITMRAHPRLQAFTTGKVEFRRGPHSYIKAIEAAREQIRREQCLSQGDWIRRIRGILAQDEQIRALLPVKQGEKKQPVESTVRSILKRLARE
jgi:hypothetical protein